MLRGRIGYWDVKAATRGGTGSGSPRVRPARAALTYRGGVNNRHNLLEVGGKKAIVHGCVSILQLLEIIVLRDAGGVQVRVSKVVVSKNQLFGKEAGGGGGLEGDD